MFVYSDIDSCSRGEEVSTRYTTPQLGSHQRVQDIQRTWHFVCQCPRCLDPTEFGKKSQYFIFTS